MLICFVGRASTRKNANGGQRKREVLDDDHDTNHLVVVFYSIVMFVLVQFVGKHSQFS